MVRWDFGGRVPCGCGDLIEAESMIKEGRQVVIPLVRDDSETAGMST
jgi:hypothetical protein